MQYLLLIFFLLPKVPPDSPPQTSYSFSLSLKKAEKNNKKWKSKQKNKLKIKMKKKISKIKKMKTKRTLIKTLEPILCRPTAPGHGPWNVVGMCSHTHWRKLSSLSQQVSEQTAPWLGVGVGVHFPFSVLGFCLGRTREGLRHTIKLCDFHHRHCWSRRHCFLGVTHHL